MASLLKTYFLTPSWNIKPQEVALGSIIANPMFPNRALVPAIPDVRIDIAVSKPDQEHFCSGTARKDSKWSAGLFANFLQFAIVGGEASFATESFTQIDYECGMMKTHRFSPTTEYVTKALENPPVKGFLKAGGFRAKVYMVTGVKIVTDITLTTTEEKKKEATAQVGVDIPVVQATAGPKVSLSSSGSNQHRRTIAGPIVFAFEVEKLRVNHRGNVVHKQHIDGALLSKSDGRFVDEVVERAGSSVDDVEMEDLELAIRVGTDDQTDEPCEILMPLLQ